jgi:hypothetical protein
MVERLALMSARAEIVLWSTVTCTCCTGINLPPVYGLPTTCLCLMGNNNGQTAGASKLLLDHY